MTGPGDYVSVPDDPSLDLSEEGSVEAWINMEDFRQYSGIVHKGEETDFSDEAYALQFYNSRHIRFGLSNEAGDYQYIESSMEIEDDQWYHLVGTWDSSEVRLYVNGVPDVSASNSIGEVRNSDGSLQIGSQLTTDYSVSTAKFGFDGVVDEVRLYDTVLTPSQVSSQYDLNKPSVSSTVSYRVSS